MLILQFGDYTTECWAKEKLNLYGHFDVNQVLEVSI
jgi:hypothetical protein